MSYTFSNEVSIHNVVWNYYGRLKSSYLPSHPVLSTELVGSADLKPTNQTSDLSALPIQSQPLNTSRPLEGATESRSSPKQPATSISEGKDENLSSRQTTTTKEKEDEGNEDDLESTIRNRLHNVKEEDASKEDTEDTEDADEEEDENDVNSSSNTTAITGTNTTEETKKRRRNLTRVSREENDRKGNITDTTQALLNFTFAKGYYNQTPYDLVLVTSVETKDVGIILNHF